MVFLTTFAPQARLRCLHINLWLVAFVALAVAFSALAVDGARSEGQASGLIAFIRADGVYVMRADGNGIRLLRRTGLWTAWVTWSPDGRKLAFLSYSTERGIWVMNADGTDPIHLADGTPATSRPTWSPDSRRIAFATSDNGGSHIWVVNADGSNLQRLMVPGSGSAPDWSPDGRRIVFSGSAQGPGIYLVNVDGSSLRKLMALGGWEDSPEPDWSPDGRRIAFVHPVPWPGPGNGTASNDEIWVMDANGRSRVRLTDNHVPDHSPAWSPDGTRIAFVGAYAGRGSGEIYVINADGTGFRRLTHNHVAEASPAWQPVAAP